MVTDIQKLLDAVDTLDHVHRTVEAKISEDLPDINPYEVRDTNGRYILLDSLTALVNARTAIAIATAMRG